MATLMKEKRKEKKKTKEKPPPKANLCDEKLETKSLIISKEEEFTDESLENKETSNFVESTSGTTLVDTQICSHVPIMSETETDSVLSSVEIAAKSEKNIKTDIDSKTKANKEVITLTYSEYKLQPKLELNFKDLNEKLAIISMSNSENEGNSEVIEISTSSSHTNVTPSAPVFVEEMVPPIPQQEIAVQIVKPKVKCMPLEEVLKLSEGDCITKLSEIEEAIVEAGPLSGPEHPLVDLLSTFRSSLIAVERHRTLLLNGFVEEERFRTALWKVEKRSVNITEPCRCGASVSLRASYQYAELLKEKLPVAKLKLEALLRDIQDSYCHHQHEALLAYCQIEDIISETVKSTKPEIREALSLVLQTLRLSDSAPVALASALERWARALVEALADATDLRQLLFVIHHLFRQSRSVRWASRVVCLTAEDYIAANRVVAVLDVLLARPKSKLDTALECTEESEEAWEEVDKHGGGGAVSEGTLREKDLLALYHSFPLRHTVAKLLLFTNSNIQGARSNEWGSGQYSRSIINACRGVRILVCALQRAVRVHAQYVRLHAALRALARNALGALAGLHLHSRPLYLAELEDFVSANLEAAFSEGLLLFGGEELNSLPATLLSSSTALEYCQNIINSLHDKSPTAVESLSVEIPPLKCSVRVLIVTQAAVDRREDHQLAETVLTFLFECGIKKKTTLCADKCDEAACEGIRRLLDAHSYLYPLALHRIADLNLLEPVDPSALKTLGVSRWRPNLGELRSVLDDWEQRCCQLLQHLLLELDYTPHTGVSYPCQLTIGSWLCSWVKRNTPTSGPEWWWRVLRRLSLHRVYWGPPIDAPPPEAEPVDLFSKAYALCSSSWGHSIPLICSEGVSTLCTLVTTHPRDATHCAGPIMALMSHSPESVSLTPKFAEFFTALLGSRPSLMQRALGRRGDSGPELLLRVMLEQLQSERWFGVEQGALLNVWLHALWSPGLPEPARGLLDTAAAACRHWPALDNHAYSILQRENSKEYLTSAVASAATAPLLCECALRCAHALCTSTHAYALLLRALDAQRASSHRIHVDNAIQQVSFNTSSEDLVIYQSAKAALVAPLHHPSHLMLWRLFMYLYLERPPDNMQDSSPPVGPLFYSGLIKTRTLGHIKKRLQETAGYHRTEAEGLKAAQRVLSPPQSIKVQKPVKIIDNSLFPTLSIADLTGESSSSDSESELTDEEGVREIETKQKEDLVIKKRDNVNLLRYHEGAEKMIREYLRWLEEGQNVRAAPHHADVAKFIPEQGLEAGWKSLLSRSHPPSDPESPTTSTSVSYPLTSIMETPFENAIKAILRIKDKSRKRPRRKVLKSSLEGVNVRDTKSLLAAIDKHLEEIEMLAKEWCSEVERVSALDGQLWALVAALRVRRPLPKVSKQCLNKCKPMQIIIPAEEWCISTGAERGIKENRSSAHTALKRLSRARPHAARSAATLNALVRCINSKEAGVRVIERVWRSSTNVSAACQPASCALTAITEHIAQRWVCSDGRVCADLVTRWSRHSASTLQQAHCSALVAPRSLPAADWPLVYTALLRAQMPDNLLFSCLTKFEMKRWSERAEAGSRRDLLDALLRAIQQWGPVPEASQHVLVELAGVHTRALLDARETCGHLAQCARISVAVGIPPSHWTHVAQAVDDCASNVPLEQLGNLLRELGVIWWEARTRLKGIKLIIDYAAYAPYFARVLHALVRAFVTVALKLSYTPERVGRCAWSALQESWSPWVSPHPVASPLLPSTGDDEAYTPLLKDFVRTIRQIMIDCPGSEVAVLQQSWEWTIQTYLGVYSGNSQESRVQMSALLEALSQLPWDQHQWCSGRCLQPALQISTVSDRELTSWCCQAWRSIRAETWVMDENERDTNDFLAPRLASLLYLFTGNTLPHTRETLEEATRLPWWRLPGPALDEALERFFGVHHNAALPYHDVPQFTVVVHASGVRVRADTASQYARSANARSVFVSQWVRNACAPALASHVATHSNTLLEMLTDLAPYIENFEGELEELMSRAVVIMCIEPAATPALPVWTSWLGKTNVRMLRACVSAVSGLTAFEYFAPLADSAVRAFVDHKEGGGWEEVRLRWAHCPWRDAGPLIMRARPYAAYALALAHVHDDEQMRTALLAFTAKEIHFKENDAMIAVWICVAGRECVRGGDALRACARTLLCAWAAPPSRSLLQVVSLQSQPPAPTPRHRALCRLALWMLEPSETTAREYETACVGVPGCSRADLAAGPVDPTQLPKVAARLYPHQESYFALELDMATATNTDEVVAA